MAERLRYMFDTVAFNRVVERKISVEALAKCVVVFSTIVQHIGINVSIR